MSWAIHDVDAGSPDAQLLMDALDADLAARYPGAVIYGIEPAGFHDAGGIFLIGYEDGTPVACGALRPMRDSGVEVKRMFVAGAARRRGHARAMLAALEEHAIRAGATAIRLETGDRQPEAIRLYESAGYHRVPCFGEYVGSPHSACFEKPLPQIDRVP